MPGKFTKKRNVLVPEDMPIEKLKPVFNGCGFWIVETGMPVSPSKKLVNLCLFDETHLNWMGKKGHKGWIGKSFEKDGVRCVVFPNISNGIEDVAGFEKSMALLSSVKIPEERIRTILTEKDLDSAVRYIRSIPYVVCDFETTTLDPYLESSKVLTLAAGNRDLVYVMPLSHKDSPWLGNTSAQKRWLTEVYKSKFLVAHNAKFELRWFMALGFPPRGIAFDPMMVHHMLDENSAHDLETLAATYTSYAGYSQELSQNLTNKHNYETAPLDVLCKYNAMDVLVTDLITVELRNELAIADNERLAEIWTKINQPLIPLLAEMEDHGFTVDTAVLQQLTDWYRSEEARYEGIIKKYNLLRKYFTDRPDFNFNSYPQLRALLYDELKFPMMRDHMTEPSPKTPNGQPSVDKNAVKAMKLTGKHKIVLDALAMRTRCNSMLKSFLNVFASKIEYSTTGRLHTNFNAHVVETFRLSSSGPNMQNLPRSEDLAAVGLEFPKKAFVTRFDGGSLVQADFSQLELRVAAMYSKDKIFCRAFEEGRDLHGEMAAKVYGPNYTKEERYKAKRTNFSAVFDIGPDALAEQIESTVPEAKKLLRGFREMHPELFSWFNGLWEEAKYQGYVENFLGRRRHIAREMEMAHKDWEIDSIRRQVWNFPIQSTAADMTLTGMLLLRDRMRKSRMKSLLIGMVHDSIIVDTVHRETGDVVSAIKDVFEHLPYEWLTVPVKIDIAVGPDLHNLEEVA